jgi:signal transduction histidine kinase
MLSAELTLRLGKLNERQIMLTKNVIEGSNRMTALVNDLLDVTRARFGAGLPVARSSMNMGFVAHQIVDEVRVVHPGRGIVLNDSGDLNGEWDRARIGQVFSNLLANAVQYSFQDSPINVAIKGTPEMVTLTVGNAGIPIPPEKIRQIFDPLTRVLPSDDSLPPFGNLGLGLYITKEVVVAHGGTIEVTSSETGGTIFTARFPRSASSSFPKDARA